MYHNEMQKKFGVYTTFSMDGKKFHPIPIGQVNKGPIQFNDLGILYTSNNQGNFHLKVGLLAREKIDVQTNQVNQNGPYS